MLLPLSFVFVRFDEIIIMRHDDFRQGFSKIDMPCDKIMPIQKTYSIQSENESDAAAIHKLHDMAFGPGRFARTAFLLREGACEARELALVARDNTSAMLIGSVRFSHIRIGKAAALLLGPLTVHPDWRGAGAGKALVQKGLQRAKEKGHQFVLLIGDKPYYGPLGFQATIPGTLTLPGPVDPTRLLIATLGDGNVQKLHGQVYGDQ